MKLSSNNKMKNKYHIVGTVQKYNRKTNTTVRTVQKSNRKTNITVRTVHKYIRKTNTTLSEQF